MSFTYYPGGPHTDEINRWGDFQRSLLHEPPGKVDMSLQVGAGGVIFGYALAAPNDPAAMGVAGTMTVKCRFVTANTNVSLTVTARRLSSDGSVFASHQLGGTQVSSTSVMTFTGSVGAFSGGQRLEIAYAFSNGHAMSAQSFTFELGTVSQEIVAPWDSLIMSGVAQVGEADARGEADAPYGEALLTSFEMELVGGDFVGTTEVSGGGSVNVAGEKFLQLESGAVSVSGGGSTDVQGFRTFLAEPYVDLVNTGWTDHEGGTTGLWQRLADGDEETFIEAEDPAVYEVRLRGEGEAAARTHHVLRYSVAVAKELNVQLRQGATVIAEWDHVGETDVAEQHLTQQQMDAITDYNNLRLRFEKVS